MWVRLPPRVPIFLSCFQSVDFRIFAYSPRIFSSSTTHRIACPNSLQISFELPLPSVNPRVVMPLGHPHALMPQEDGDSLNWDSRHRELNGKRISKPVGMAAEACQSEQFC
jgi:hypothetical protein